MSPCEQEIWISQAGYAKKLRPLLPGDAFEPSKHRILILLINIAILLLGWGLARHLTQWSWPLLFLPFAIIMGNSVVVLLFSTHDILHSSAIRQPHLRQVLSLFSLSLLWMPPTLWKAVHNREHHRKTNSMEDPDRNYLFNQPNSWGKWIQNLFVPSVNVHPFWLSVGMSSAWGVHAFRNLTSVLLFNNGETRYPVFSFKVSPRERRWIAIEILGIVAIHLTILGYLNFQFTSILMGYFLPIWIGYSVIMFYVYTNHMLCRMTSFNDPLVNSASLRVSKWLDLLHFNFSFHTEHHIFPGLNSDYYPLVQGLLQQLYPDRLQLLEACEAWHLMLRTPRHYLNETTFITDTGDQSMPCPLSARRDQVANSNIDIHGESRRLA
jgi:fatty acid desaturase